LFNEALDCLGNGVLEVSPKEAHMPTSGGSC
jgi:hypothetical protein